MNFKDFIKNQPKTNYVAEQTSKDFRELLDNFMDKNKIYGFESYRGVNNFKKIIKVLGYNDLEDFFSDNPGGLENVVEWMCDQYVDSWVEAFSELESGEE